MSDKTKLGQNNLDTQLKLYGEVVSSYQSIIYAIQSRASEVLNEVIKPKMYMKNGQETVELTVDEFTKLRVALAQLGSSEGNCEINSYIDKAYITPKNRNLEIIEWLKK